MKKQSLKRSLILAVIAPSLIAIMLNAVAMTTATMENTVNYEFHSGFENGFDDWDGITRGFPDDPKINNTIVHSGNCSMYCYSNHGVYKIIPDSSIIDVQFYYSIEYTNLHCSPSHMLSIRNNALNPDEAVVFATLFLYCQSDEGNLPAMIELKYLNGTAEQYEYVWNGSIPYVQWVPTGYHSIRMKLCLETSEGANDGTCRVWLDDEMIMSLSGLDTLVSTANQVNIGQSSTFSAYAFFDDVTILADGTTSVSEPSTVPIIVLIVIIALVAVTVVFIALRRVKSSRQLQVNW